MSFASLKKSSGSSFASLSTAIEKMNKPSGSKVDERLWKPEVDKSGNGYAVIRFLPETDGDLPWAQVWSHAFQGPGGWYIENSLTTLGQKDPVGELNRQLWNSGIDADKEVARKQKRKLSYYSNIYVVRDPLHPENEGKVFLYKYGKKIHDKIVAAAQPQFEDETPINPFDFWKGADFKLKITKVAGFWNYDKSEFDRPGTLGGFSDAELEGIYNKEYSLKEFTDPSNFKSYEELETRLSMVLNKRSTPRVDESLEDESEGRGSFNSPDITPSAQSVTGSVPSGFGDRVESVQQSSDEPDLSYFEDLAAEL
jgi:hypothetical protein|tara:strand:- start:17 stop:949 length:933 start_codon:yes stop_codon:yes gene_type:complete